MSVTLVILGGLAVFIAGFLSVFYGLTYPWIIPSWVRVLGCSGVFVVVVGVCRVVWGWLK